MNEVEAALAEVADEFAFFSDWEERYAHILDMGRTLAPLSGPEHNDATRVRGCASQVWLVTDARSDAPERLFFRGDSDAHLVRGLIAVLLRIFSGRLPADIASVTPQDVASRLGLVDALTPQRSNGLFAMMRRIQAEAAQPRPA